MDNNVPPVPFNEGLYSRYAPVVERGDKEGEREKGSEENTTKKIRFGYYVDDGYFEPFSGCQRAVIEAKEALEDAGFEVVPFPITEMGMWDCAMKVMLGLYTANHHQNFFDALKESEVDPAMVTSPPPLSKAQHGSTTPSRRDYKYWDAKPQGSSRASQRRC